MTHAMILAAGRGERMRPLTDDTPKPLLKAGKHRLIEHQIRALAASGFVDIVINHAHLGSKIVALLGDGVRYGVRITYSAEPPGALETGGGLKQALPLLKSDPFVVVNGDIWTDYPFSRLQVMRKGLAHLVMVANPGHNPSGDFVLKKGLLSPPQEALHDQALTYSGIGMYKHELFDKLEPGRFPLAPLLIEAMAENLVTGEYYGGEWLDIGTPERLQELNEKLKEKPR